MIMFYKSAVKLLIHNSFKTTKNTYNQLIKLFT